MALLDTLRTLRRRPSRRAARFLLIYEPPASSPVKVGVLEYDTRWTFRYDEEYKSRRDLRPIEGFDELDKVYKSSVLFPFFAVRIPDDHRPDVKRKLEEARVSDPDDTDLLRIFGRRVASSPAFELLPIST